MGIYNNMKPCDYFRSGKSTAYRHQHIYDSYIRHIGWRQSGDPWRHVRR